MLAHVANVVPLLTRRISAPLFWAIASQGALAGGMLAALKLVATALGPAGYGVYAMGLAISGSITLLLFGPLGQLVLRYYGPSSGAEPDAGFFRYVNATFLRLSSLALGVGLAAAAFLGWHGNTDYAALVAMGSIHGFTTGSILLVSAAANASGRQARVALANMLDHGLRVLFILGLMARPGVFNGYWMLASTCAASAAALLILCWARGDLRWSFEVRGASSFGNVARYRAYLGPFLFFAWFAAASAYADRYILDFFCGRECVGIFSAALSIANGVTAIMANALMQVVVPLVFAQSGLAAGNESGTHPRSVLPKACIAYVVGVAICTGGALAFGEPIMALLTSASFAASATILPGLMLAYGAFYFAQLLSIHGLIDEDSRRYVVPKALHAALVVGMGVVLVPMRGEVGMTWALLAAAVIYTALIALVNRVKR